MSVEDGHAIETESRGKDFEHSLPHSWQSYAAGELALERCHRYGIAIAPHIAEQFQVGIGIHNHAEARNIVAHGRTDVGDPPTIHANSRVHGIRRSDQLVFAKQVDDHALQFIDVSRYAQSE
jgi:hypothetical protein